MEVTAVENFDAVRINRFESDSGARRRRRVKLDRTFSARYARTESLTWGQRDRPGA
jgi:hypothetical protein